MREHLQVFFFKIQVIDYSSFANSNALTFIIINLSAYSPKNRFFYEKENIYKKLMFYYNIYTNRFSKNTLLLGVFIFLLLLIVTSSVLWKSLDPYTTFICSGLPIYYNADVQKKKILGETRKKAGVYLWKNLVNEYKYVGSSVNLKKRFYDYYSVEYLKVKRGKLINFSLLYNGYSNFSLEILEYCDIKDLLKREKYYIGLLKPEYNKKAKIRILPFNPSLGHKGRYLINNKVIEPQSQKSNNNNNKKKSVIGLRPTNSKRCFSSIARKGIFLPITYVKMSIARRQSAWGGKNFYSSHQRLNKEYLKNNKNWFEQWLVGITDGDGSFSITRQNYKWSLVFKIALSRYNLRALYYIKTQLGIGVVTKDNTKGQILIRDRKKLEKFIFPIFDKYPLLTSKQFNYERFKKAFFILENHNLTKQQKDIELFFLKNKSIAYNYISPVWNDTNLPLKTVKDISAIMTKPWLVGFIEAEGSFYLVSKTSTRISHGFGLTQKLDSVVLEGIRLTLHMPNAVKYKSNYGHYILDTTNSRAIENIIKYFNNTMKGMKSVEYRIWARAYNKYKGDYKKLSGVREIVRKLKTRLLEC